MMQRESMEWLPEGTIRIPLLGEVAAGQPLEVFSVEERLDVPESLWKGRKVFALRVRGQSMVDAGIRDGDYLIVEPADDAADGRTVVAEVDGAVTVKKLYREPGGEVRLQPANPEMLPLVVRGERVRIRGVVVGVLRKVGFGAPRTPVAAPRSAPTKLSVVKPARRPEADEATLDLALNALDAHLARWKTLADEGVQRLSVNERARMASMARDLQALRDWGARTSKPQLRRAVIRDASRVIERMQRFLRARSLELPEATVH
jgi:repressor LexA